MVGIDDLDGGFDLVPRLPDHMTAITAGNVPVTVGGKVGTISFRYARDEKGDVRVTDGQTTYSLTIEGAKPGKVRVGPFAKSDITTNAVLTDVRRIGQDWYAYISL